MRFACLGRVQPVTLPLAVYTITSVVTCGQKVKKTRLENQVRKNQVRKSHNWSWLRISKCKREGKCHWALQT